jgi:hypothetical protein
VENESLGGQNAATKEAATKNAQSEQVAPASPHSGVSVICTGFFARFAQAQLTNGDVIGTVTDTSGAVIPGATVGLLPGDTPTSAGGLGATTSTVPGINPRQFQLALKLLF